MGFDVGVRTVRVGRKSRGKIDQLIVVIIVGTIAKALVMMSTNKTHFTSLKKKISLNSSEQKNPWEFPKRLAIYTEIISLSNVSITLGKEENLPGSDWEDRENNIE